MAPTMHAAELSLTLVMASWSLGVGFAIVVFRYLWVGAGPARRVVLDSITMLSGFFLGLVAAEWITRHHVILSDGWNFTYSAQRWFERYWHPINSAGFRDGEHSARPSGKTLVVLGDSFATGHGVRRIEDRFASVIAREIEPEWNVVMLARNGWNTRDEIRALGSYPGTIEAVLLSYYVNDVDDRPAEESRSEFRGPPDGVAGGLIEKSHLANFVYWWIYRRTFGSRYWSFVRDHALNEGVWREHVEQIDALVGIARDRGIELSVIVWPHLERVSESADLTRRVALLFAERDVPTIDLAPLFAGRTPRELVVNALDVHPNAVVHAEVASLWLERVGVSPSSERGW